jgi:hypothetical protein
MVSIAMRILAYVTDKIDPAANGVAIFACWDAEEFFESGQLCLHCLPCRDRDSIAGLKSLQAEASRRKWEMLNRNTVVAVLNSQHGAEDALRELQRAGVDLQTLSVVGKQSPAGKDAMGRYYFGDRIKSWGETGAFWGGVWGMLFGSAFFAGPGIGPVLVAGPLVAWIVVALEGAALGGLSAIGAGLCGMGIPKESAARYETALKTGKLLLMVQGTVSGVEQARDVIGSTRPVHLTLHTAEAKSATARVSVPV